MLSKITKPLSDEELEEGEFEECEDSNEESSEFIKTTKAGKKYLCDTCTKSLSKYTCPACDTRSCTLACINKHKISKECDGKVKKNEYVQKNKIDGEIVRKDFEYVKSMLEETDKVKKTLTGVTTQTQEPKRFYFLRKQAKVEYNIKIHQAPAMMERHRENISFFYMKTKTIYWVIEILYFKANKKYTKLILEPQPDSKKVDEILPKEFLCQELLLKGINTQKPEEFDVFIENRQAVGENTEKETIPEKERLIEVTKSKELFEVLRNLNIYEFPTFILVHKTLKKSFLKCKRLI